MKVRKGKTLECKICGEEVHNCGTDAEKVTCWKCVNRMMTTGVDLLTDDEEDEEDQFTRNDK